MASVSSGRITRNSSSMSLGVEVEVAAETDSAFGSNFMSTLQASEDLFTTEYESEEVNLNIAIASSLKELNLSTFKITVI